MFWHYYYFYLFFKQNGTKQRNTSVATIFMKMETVLSNITRSWHNFVASFVLHMLCDTTVAPKNHWHQGKKGGGGGGGEETKRQHSQSLVIAFCVDEQKCTCFHPYTLQSRIWPMQLLSLFFVIMKQKLVGLRCFNGYKVCQLSLRTSWLVR